MERVHGTIQKSGGEESRLVSLGVKTALGMTEMTHVQRKGIESLLFSCHYPSRYAPGYLDGTLHDECGELRHHKVHTFEAGLFEFEDLLFDNRLESQVRGEEPRSEPSRVQSAFCCCGGGGGGGY